MKAPRIINAVGHIDDDLISGANHAKAVKKNAWLKWISIAACFVIILAAVANYAPIMFGGDNPIPPIISESTTHNNVGSDGTTPPTSSENPTNPSTNEGPKLEKYYDYQIKNSAFTPYIGGKVIEESKIGSKLESVIVTAGWKNEAGEWLTIETLNAEIYAISCVESDVAVALRFIDKGEAITTTHYYTLTHPNAEYNGTIFPDYVAENPIRYLEEGDMGKSNGWQDLGLNGEIRTITVPIGSSYVYQMYSYYIRNDLQHIYWNEELPDTLKELPKWLSDTKSAGRRSFWYSMGLRIPVSITVEATAKITSENDAMQFIKTEYKVKIKDGANEKEENWVVYFMEENGVYSAFAVLANENFDFVKSYSESIVKSYQQKSL